MRRRHRTNVVSLPLEKPWDLETEISQVIEARHKLQTAIANEKRWHDTEELELVTRVVKEIGARAVVDIDSLMRCDEAGKHSLECYSKRVEVLENTLARVSRRIEQFKSDSSWVVSSILSKKIEALEKSAPTDQSTSKEAQDQLSQWKEELSKLPKGTPKKAIPPQEKQA